MIVNRTFEELAVGDHAAFEHVVTANDLYLFAHASGNRNPIHVPGIDGDGDGVADELAPAIWISSLISAAIGNLLPGAGTRYLRENLRFRNHARIGDRLNGYVSVAHKPAPPIVILDVRVMRGDDVIADGIVEVEAPLRKVVLPEQHMPAILIAPFQHFERLLAACDRLDPLATAVVCPHDALSLRGALAAHERNLIVPVLVGAGDLVAHAASAIGADLKGLDIIEAATDEEAAQAAVELVQQKKVRALMKGDLHTDALMRAVLADRGGLKKRRRVSHAFVLDVPGLDHLLIISDAAINIAPNLDEKAGIVQNAIDLAHALGIDLPRVGILSAVETVNPAIPSTVDAALLAKMAERGQISGGLVDGPLAMDNAVDLEAARTKGITSVVAGRADVLIVPNLEAGNILVKEMTFLAHADAAGLVIGAAAPIMLTSRADDERARVISAALAILYEHWQRTGRSHRAAKASA